MANRVTLLDPPPQDASKAPIENVLELTPVVDLGPVGTMILPVDAKLMQDLRA